MRSLLARLVLGLLLSLGIAFAIQWSIVRTAIDKVVTDYIASGLADDAEELFNSLSVLPSGESTLAITHFDPPFLEPYSGRYYQILVDGQTALRSPSLADESLAFGALDRGRTHIEQVAGPRQQELLLSATGYDFRGRAITIGVAGDLHGIRTQFREFLNRYTKVSAIMLALLVGLQVAIVRMTLAPLSQARTEVSRLERGEIAQLGEQVPTEVLPFVREINGLLALLTRRLQRSRDALGNLAHALKTPLSVLQHIADDERVRLDSETGRQMSEQLDLLRGRIDTELRRARVAGGISAQSPLDIATEIDALVRTLRKLYRDRGLDIACRIEPAAKFAGDREDFLELCGNLMDNACKWARGRVLVTVHNGTRVVLSVEDDGPGCSTADLERITRRGVRLDEAMEGHGLGLAIADSIVSSYDAEMHFGRSETLGGFAVTVSFPRAPHSTGH
jgi:signal transduction histidine kinase